MSEITLKKTQNEIEIKKIVLYNSASYSYFESDFDNHLLLEGDNNAGKTSILNILQLLFLPEENLNKLNTKFAMSSGHDGKKYTGRTTYNYYFPDENSYALIEIKNKQTQFCVLIYRGNKTKLQYIRHIFETTYENIKHFFIKDKELQNTNLKQMIVNLTQVSNDVKIIKDKKGIKEILYSPQGNINSKFNLVPLKDQKESTIENFSLLFKSMYQISNMNKQNTKKLIADIITTQNVEKGKNYDFNLHDLISKYRDLDNQQTKLQLFKKEESNFLFIKENYPEQTTNKQNIENNLALLYQSTKKEKEKLKMEWNKCKTQDNLFKEQIEKVEEKKKVLTEDMAELKGDIKSKNNNKEEIIASMNKIVDYIVRYKFLPNITEIINKDRIIESREYLIVKLEERKKLLAESQSKNQEEYKSLESVIKEQKNIEKEIEEKQIDKIAIQKEIKELKKQLDNRPLDEEEEFDFNEQQILKNIFKDVFLKNKIKGLGEVNIRGIKSFLSLFDVNEGNITINEITIPLYLQETNQLELILKDKEQQLELIINDIRNIKELQKEDKEIVFKNIKEQQKILIEKLKEIDNIIYFIKNIEEKEREYKILESQIKDINKEIEDLKLLTEREETKHKTLKIELNDTNKIINDLFSTDKTLDELIQKMEDSEKQVFFNNKEISELNIIDDTVYDEYIDHEPELKKIEKDIVIHKDIQRDMFDKLQRFITLKVFEGIFSDIFVLNYQNKKEFLQLFNYLSEQYLTLGENEEYLNNETEALATETLGAINVLKEARRDVIALEKTINEEFNHLKISDLQGIKFEIILNKELESKIKKLEKSVDVNESYLDSIVEVNNYLINHSDETGVIKLETLIQDIEYQTLIEGSYTVNTQSHGTETMITLIFLTLLFKEIFKSGYSFKIPIPVDEIGKVDIKNVNTLLNVLDDRGFTLVGALPNTIPEFREIFPKTIVVDREELQRPYSNKRVLYVEPGSDFFNIFKVDNVGA